MYQCSIKNSCFDHSDFPALSMLTSDVCWVVWVLASSVTQVQSQITLDPDYISDYLFVSYDYNVTKHLFLPVLKLQELRFCSYDQEHLAKIGHASCFFLCFTTRINHFYIMYAFLLITLYHSSFVHHLYYFITCTMIKRFHTTKSFNFFAT